MKTMKWLLHREFWEHKGAFIWAPAVIALVMILFLGGGMIYGLADSHFREVVSIDGHEFSIVQMPPAIRTQLAGLATSSYMVIATPLFVVLPVVVFFYCLAALYDDRRDRSILFWKSLPMSDRMTVLSKVVTALVVAPLITIAIGTATALFLLFAGATGATFKGLSMFGPLLTSPNLYLAPLSLLALLPVYVVWALPTAGWLLLVSSWARSKVFLWAVGVPLITVVLLKWFNFMVSRFTDSTIGVNWFMDNVINRILGGLIPGLWLPMSGVPISALGTDSGVGINLGALVTQSWMTLAQPGVWIGAAAGVAMLLGAVRLRRWRDEG